MSAALNAVGLAATAGLLLGAHGLAALACPPAPEFLPHAPKTRPKHRDAGEPHRGWEPGELPALQAEVEKFTASVPTPDPCGTCGRIPHAVLIANRNATEEAS